MSRSEKDAESLETLCRSVVEAAGFDLVLLKWATDRGRRVLRLFIDQDEVGVTVEDCATVSRRLGHLLDAEDRIPGAYTLEVSTPGLDRPLCREKDFRRFLGSLARITLSKPLANGRKRLEGVLCAVHGGTIRMTVDGEEVEVELADLAKANLVYQGE